MRTIEELAAELDELIAQLYYTDDYMFIGYIKCFVDELKDEEQSLFREIVFRRLSQDGSVVNFYLCGAMRIPNAVPTLIAKLNEQAEASQLSRVLLQVLAKYKGDAVYTSVARFVDSEQEMEALTALARIDFVKTLPLMSRLTEKPHFLDSCLHILQHRRNEVGLPDMIRELKSYNAVANEGSRFPIERILGRKEGDYNPFSPVEIDEILAKVRDG